MELKDRIESQLNELGSTEKDVLNKLMELGIKGKRGKTCGCQIANYLNGKNDRQLAISSVRRSSTICLSVILDALARDAALDSAFLCTIPQHIEYFIRHFDLGQYPKLEKK